MKPQENADVDVRISRDGNHQLLVNGEDLLPLASAFAVIVDDGKPPVLQIRLPLTGLEVTGPGVVTLEPEVPANPRDIVLAFLNSLSPQKIEEEAFATADFNTLASEAIIEHLKRLV